MHDSPVARPLIGQGALRRDGLSVALTSFRRFFKGSKMPIIDMGLGANVLRTRQNFLESCHP